MRRLTIDLSEPSFAALVRRALDERRSPRDQASFELERLFPPDQQEREPARPCPSEGVR